MKIQKKWRKKMSRQTIVICILCVLALATVGCATKEKVVQKPKKDDGLVELEKRIKRAQESNGTFNQKRPDYLPSAMYDKLPEFPKDFYSRRSLIRIGKIKDMCNIREEYWIQPEFFPKFEEIGVNTLRNPPKGRFGAYGIMSFPAESVMSIEQGESLEVCFFFKSSYLIELYQGISLRVEYPDEAIVTSGYELPDRSGKVKQIPSEVSKYFDVEITPDLFVIAPNFPLFSQEGTKRVKVKITAKPDTPPGSYAIGVNTKDVPRLTEDKWMEEYLTLYATGTRTQIGRPYFTAFVTVK